jgi:hypothetical protein
MVFAKLAVTIWCPAEPVFEQITSGVFKHRDDGKGFKRVFGYQR